MKKRLLKDIVIPEGTIFEKAPVKTIRYGSGHFSCVLELTKDISGDFTYCADLKDLEIKEYFEDVSVSKKC